MSPGFGPQLSCGHKNWVLEGAAVVLLRSLVDVTPLLARTRTVKPCVGQVTLAQVVVQTHTVRLRFATSREGVCLYHCVCLLSCVCHTPNRQCVTLTQHMVIWDLTKVLRLVLVTANWTTRTLIRSYTFYISLCRSATGCALLGRSPTYSISARQSPINGLSLQSAVADRSKLP